MGVPISRSAVLLQLANAHRAALKNGDALLDDPALEQWRSEIHWLGEARVPITYTAVFAVILTARALYESDQLDVREIKTSASDRGYSASSIGSAVSAFAKEHNVDLRATSSQPMNNQPFTFKDRFDYDTKVKATLASQWQRFNELADRVQLATSDEARAALSLLMLLRRARAASAISVPDLGGLADFQWASAVVADFVKQASDSGKVGQAFVAAVLDCVYGEGNVVQGNAQDPDASRVGDVHVERDGKPWLWVEVKQKVIGTGEIKGFMEKVTSAGGVRTLYCALENEAYPSQITTSAVDKAATKLDCLVDVRQSPLATIEIAERWAPGSLGAVGALLIERLHARLQEAGAAVGTMQTFNDEVAELVAARADR